MSKSTKTVIPAKAGIQQAKGLVPRLRFPEFREAGEWQENQLADIATLHKGKGISKADIKEAGSQPCIRYGELYTVYGDVISEAVSKTDVSPDDLFMSREGDVIIPSSGETKIDIATAACVLRENVALGGDLNVIRSEQHGVFLSYYLNGSLKREIAKVAQGDTVVHLYKSNLEALTLAIPEVQEQKKIADCLSSLDALIAAQADKIDALKTHKKGLMQQLFPREGETVPRLRFPQFRDAGEWNVGTIGDVADVSSGGTPNRSEAEYWNGDIPWVSTSLIDFGTIEFANEYITREGLDNSSAKIVPNGTVLMAMYGQGKTRGKVGVLGINAAINQACAAISVKDVVLSEFVFQNLAGRYDEIRRISNAGGQENLSGALIKDISFKFPSIESGEQEKIADCLSSLDSIIAAHSEKLDALRAHKKGLMQQLFPPAKKVEG